MGQVETARRRQDDRLEEYVDPAQPWIGRNVDTEIEHTIPVQQGVDFDDERRRIDI